MVVRGHLSQDQLQQCLDTDRLISIMMAPGLGLMLDSVDYSYYHANLDRQLVGQDRERLAGSSAGGVSRKLAHAKSDKLPNSTTKESSRY